jgi:thiamine pyrophosphokinase
VPAERKRVLILGNGAWGRKEVLNELIEQVDVIVAADGGWAKAQRCGVAADVVIGDLDSLTVAERDALDRTDVKVLRYPTEKDRTDLEIALDYAMSLNPEKILLWGFWGGRLDHSLANLLLLEKAVQQRIPVEIVTDAERAHLVSEHLDLGGAAIGDLVSLLPLTATVERVRTVGLKYALVGETLRRASSRGVSNLVNANPVRIEFESGLLFVVHRPTRGERGERGRDNREA